jgi:CheY-like chemotaxis protein
MGFVDVVSTPARGSTFYVYLPVPKSKTKSIGEKRSDTANPHDSARTGHGETVLFVEDELRQLKLMQSFLESEGYTVISARDGAEAVESFRQHKNEISIVVLDIGLPKLNGWEAFMKMRAERPDVKVIFATGYMSAEMESGVAQGDLSGVIMKPYQLDDVLAKISQALRADGVSVTTDYMAEKKSPAPRPGSKVLGDS